jgi:hypothetical protein
MPVADFLLKIRWQDKANSVPEPPIGKFVCRNAEKQTLAGKNDRTAQHSTCFLRAKCHFNDLVRGKSRPSGRGRIARTP